MANIRRKRRKRHGRNAHNVVDHLAFRCAGDDDGTMGTMSQQARDFSPRFVSHHHVGRRWIKLNSFLAKRNTNNEFSVLSYNVLADDLLSHHKELYSHCPTWCLSWEYRRENIMKELIHSRGEIMCLQEVEKDFYDDWLLPRLKQHGYSGFYKKRSGDKVDGCAVFFKDSVFNLLILKDIEFNRKSSAILDRDNIGILLLLQFKHNPDHCICVATTHLLFNPNRGDIKLIQLACLLAEINSVARISDRSSCSGSNSSSQPSHYPVILCGDFNSRPKSPLYNFVCSSHLAYQGLQREAISAQLSRMHGSRVIPAELIPPELNLSNDCVWNDGLTANQTSEPTANATPTASSGVLRHQLNLQSVYRHEFNDGSPEVTTKHSMTCCTVDYIFYSPSQFPDKQPAASGQSGLVLTGLLTLMNAEMLHQFRSLPCPEMSSDHIPLLASFKIA